MQRLTAANLWRSACGDSLVSHDVHHSRRLTGIKRIIYDSTITADNHFVTDCFTGL